MSSIYLRHLVSTGVAGIVFSATASAGIPVWTFSAPNPAAVTVSSGGTATVQYTVTNQSAKPKNLKLKATPGLSASACQLATRGSTCTLTLTIKGSALPASGIHGGPMLCEQGNLNQCYQPSLPNVLNVTVGSINPTPTPMAAVGTYVTAGSQNVPLSYYSMDGGNNWVVSSMLPEAQGTGPNVLTSTSCNSKGFCAAVGSYERSGGALAPLSYYSTDNGKNWVASFPIQSPFFSTQLTSVSCNDSGSCVTVGFMQIGSKIPLSYYSSDNGRTWAFSTTQPASRGDDLLINSVSCTNSGLCTAVGYYDTSGILAPLSYYSIDGGNNWGDSSQMPQSVNAFSNQLTSVSCSVNGSCTAVGSYENGPRQVPLSYYSTDSGNNWTVSTTMPQAIDTKDNLLKGVSCDSSNCAAVGTYILNNVPTPLSYYSLDGGKKWIVSSAMPKAPNVDGNELAGIVCKANGFCTAVGSYVNSGNVPLSYYSIDNGKNWTISSTLPQAQSIGDNRLNSAG